ncbi:MAG: hypothetical protein AAF939_01770 [Planctomycetota bacterium]
MHSQLSFSTPSIESDSIDFVRKDLPDQRPNRHLVDPVVLTASHFERFKNSACLPKDTFDHDLSQMSLVGDLPSPFFSVG